MASFSRCWIRSLMDEMSSRLTASWAVCWSTVSVIVFCCACIRSSFWPMLLSILCRACVSWAKWCASGGPDASRAGSSRPSPRTFLRGGEAKGLVAGGKAALPCSSSISMGESMGRKALSLKCILTRGVLTQNGLSQSTSLHK